MQLRHIAWIDAVYLLYKLHFYHDTIPKAIKTGPVKSLYYVCIPDSAPTTGPAGDVIIEDPSIPGKLPAISTRGSIVNSSHLGQRAVTFSVSWL
jgi:hypothetical protein